MAKIAEPPVKSRDTAIFSSNNCQRQDFSKYKEKSQDGFPLLFYADSSSNIPSFLIHPMNQYIYHYTC